MKKSSARLASFLISITILILIVSFSGIDKYFGYYNINPSVRDSVELVVEFASSSNLDNKELSLHYAFADSTNTSYNDKMSIEATVYQNKCVFNFSTKKIPSLFRLNFRNLENTIFTIESISLSTGTNSIDINLNSFIPHPSIEIKNKTDNHIDVDTSPKKYVNYDPYIYLKYPIYLHKISNTEIALLIFAILLVSLLISELVVNIKDLISGKDTINSILLFLLFITLPFLEHWTSKVLIIITLYSIYKFFKQKIAFSSIKSFGYFWLFLFSGFSLIWSIDFGESTSLLIRLLPMVILPFWATTLDNSINYKSIVKYVGVIYILIAIITILLASIRFNSTLDFSEFFYHKLVSPLEANAIYISLLFLTIYCYNLYLLQNYKKSFLRIIILLSLFIYIVILSSKMLTFLLILSSAIIVLSKEKSIFLLNYRALMTGIGVATIIGVLVFSSSFLSNRFLKIVDVQAIADVFKNDKFGSDYEWNGLSLRLFQLRCFIDIEQDAEFNSIWGVGLNNGQVPLDERYVHYDLYQGRPWEIRGGFLYYNYHNQYAQTLIEIGVIGFIFLMIILYRLLRESQMSSSALSLTVVIILIFLMMSESLLIRQKGIVAFVLFPLIALKISASFTNETTIKKELIISPLDI